MSKNIRVSYPDLQSFWHSHGGMSDKVIPLFCSFRMDFNRRRGIFTKVKDQANFHQRRPFLQESINIQKGFEPIMQGIWLEWLEVSCHVLIKCKQSLRPPKKPAWEVFSHGCWAKYSLLMICTIPPIMTTRLATKKLSTSRLLLVKTPPVGSHRRSRTRIVVWKNGINKLGLTLIFNCRCQ